MNFRKSYNFFKPEEFEEILKEKSWYIKLLPQLNKYIFKYHKNKENTNDYTQDFLHERQEFIEVIGEYLRENKIACGEINEFYFDKERKPIDTVVIHHRGRNTNADLEYIESVELMNLFVRDFILPGTEYFKKPIFSGHKYKNRQCFLAYHYIVYPDGNFEQILKDEYIGWHCGNRDYNNRSIGIMIMDTLIDKEPSNEAIESIRKIIKKYHPKEVLGHGEIKQNESCPGNLFLGENGWRQKLLKY